MRRAIALLAPALLLSVGLAGCFQEAVLEDAVVPYPRLGDRVTYTATGALVELARWENGHPFGSSGGEVRFIVDASDPVIDGARAVHDAYHVTTQVGGLGPFVKRSERFVSPAHQATIQGWYPLSQDQSVLSFDERGFPWLFGASALFGAQLSREPRHPFVLPDNLGHGREMVLAWVVKGEEDVDGVSAIRLDLEGSDSLEGSLWFERGSAWPVRARLAVLDDGLAPHVRIDGDYPATIDARRGEIIAGNEPVAPRDRAAVFQTDMAVDREKWDGEAPPDGDADAFEYALSDAMADAKLLDQGLQDWLAHADDPRLYRGTYAGAAGPFAGSREPSWLLQWVDKSERYYEVAMARLRTDLVQHGIPVVSSSGPTAPPEAEVHGWFAAADVPNTFVPLSEGVRVVKQVFGMPDVQVFLRSLKQPAGYSYYIDGGFEVDGGRYTVVYAPNGGFMEHATGPVSPRFATG